MGLHGGATPTRKMKDLGDHTQTHAEKTSTHTLPSHVEQMLREDFNHLVHWVCLRQLLQKLCKFFIC